VAFRQHAINRGFTLNEKGLAPLPSCVTDIPYMKDEADIFGFLGLEFVAPSNRVDGNQIKGFF
jgi:DNA polymerase/3'-5' exonuclease PolX